MLAERQHGIVSRGQLRALGMADEAITLRVAAGTLHRIFPGTFAVGHRAIGRKGRMLAAVLACGDGTVLSHGSAAELIGLWDKQSSAIDVISPRRAGRKIDGVRWHNVRRPVAEEIEVRAGVPCTTPSRTLVDMAGRLGQPSLHRMVEQAAILRLLDVDDVGRVLSRGRRRGGPILRAILSSWRGIEKPRLRSPLEARLLSILIENDLPLPQCNAELAIEGRRFEVDLLWERQRLVVETDGEQTHGTRAAFQRDRWRDQVLVAAGYRAIRITWSQLDTEQGAVIARIRRALGAK